MSYTPLRLMDPVQHRPFDIFPDIEVGFSTTSTALPGAFLHRIQNAYRSALETSLATWDSSALSTTLDGQIQGFSVTLIDCREDHSPLDVRLARRLFQSYPFFANSARCT